MERETLPPMETPDPPMFSASPNPVSSIPLKPAPKADPELKAGPEPRAGPTAIPLIPRSEGIPRPAPGRDEKYLETFNKWQMTYILQASLSFPLKL